MVGVSSALGVNDVQVSSFDNQVVPYGDGPELCPDVLILIFSYLSQKDLGLTVSHVCWRWKILADDPLDKAILTKVLYGHEQWAPHAVEKLPLRELCLREDILKALKEPSYITEEPNKRVFETHKLLEIPATVDGEPCSLDSGKEWVEYNFYADAVKNEHGGTEVEKTYLALMPNAPLPGSKRKRWEQVEELFRDSTKNPQGHYRWAKVIEVVVQRKVGRVTQDDTEYVVRGSERVNIDGAVRSVVVGGFASGELYVHYRNFGSPAFGGVACREFPSIGT